MCARAVERLQIGMDDAICMQQPEASRQGHDHVDRFAEIEVFLYLVASPHARYVQMKRAINNGVSRGTHSNGKQLTLVYLRTYQDDHQVALCRLHHDSAGIFTVATLPRVVDPAIAQLLVLT